MLEVNNILQDTESSMQKTYSAFRHKLEGLNAGRATPELLSGLKVEAYGGTSTLISLANISVQEPRTLVVNVWDKALVNNVDSAIRAANLGFNPVIDGTILKIHIPQPTEERRKDLVKLVSSYAEEAKISQKKTHRREALNKLEVLKKTNGLSEDDYHTYTKKIELLTNIWVSKIDDLLKKKIKELETI